MENLTANSLQRQYSFLTEEDEVSPADCKFSPVGGHEFDLSSFSSVIDEANIDTFVKKRKKPTNASSKNIPQWDSIEFVYLPSGEIFARDLSKSSSNKIIQLNNDRIDDEDQDDDSVQASIINHQFLTLDKTNSHKIRNYKQQKNSFETKCHSKSEKTLLGINEVDSERSNYFNHKRKNTEIFENSSVSSEHVMKVKKDIFKEQDNLIDDCSSESDRNVESVLLRRVKKLENDLCKEKSRSFDNMNALVKEQNSRLELENQAEKLKNELIECQAEILSYKQKLKEKENTIKMKDIEEQKRFEILLETHSKEISAIAKEKKLREDELKDLQSNFSQQNEVTEEYKKQLEKMSNELYSTTDTITGLAPVRIGLSYASSSEKEGFLRKFVQYVNNVQTWKDSIYRIISEKQLESPIEHERSLLLQEHILNALADFPKSDNLLDKIDGATALKDNEFTGLTEKNNALEERLLHTEKTLQSTYKKYVELKELCARQCVREADLQNFVNEHRLNGNLTFQRGSNTIHDTAANVAVSSPPSAHSTLLADKKGKQSGVKFDDHLQIPKQRHIVQIPTEMRIFPSEQLNERHRRIPTPTAAPITKDPLLKSRNRSLHRKKKSIPPVSSTTLAIKSGFNSTYNKKLKSTQPAISSIHRGRRKKAAGRISTRSSIPCNKLQRPWV